MAFDVAIIGGGIIGTAAATYLAEAGQSVVVFEQSELAAGASGRNSGALQHPFDPLLAPLHRETVELYAELAAIERRFELPRKPAGLLLVGSDPGQLTAARVALAASAPELAPELVDPAALRALEPALAEGLGAVRLETGYPVVPAAATLAFARRAARAGALFRIGDAATPIVEGDGVVGVRLGPAGESVTAGQVLIAAGPWTSELIQRWRADPPIRRTWGVVASVRLRHAPRHIIEQYDIEPSIAGAATAFSLVTAGGATSVGSTFLYEQPDADEWAPRLVAAGTRFVPALADAPLTGARACARPLAFDRRPLIGALDVTGMYVCAGHGPWGISIGPASARMVAAQMMTAADNATALPAELSAERWLQRQGR